MSEKGSARKRDR